MRDGPKILNQTRLSPSNRKKYFLKNGAIPAISDFGSEIIFVL